MHARIAAAGAMLLVAAVVGGCFSGGPPLGSPSALGAGEVQFLADSVKGGLARLDALAKRPTLLPVDVTIHVVFVGLDAAPVDTAAIDRSLPHDYSPFVRWGRVPEATLRSGLRQDVRYEFHPAPDAFARDLFAFYPTASRDVPIPRDPGTEAGFLDRYDAMYQLGRTRSGVVHIVDATAVETWIHEHRAEAGLAFAKPSYTVFFLDSHTRHRLWADGYYWYEYPEEAATSPDAMNLRAWGGTYDFLFLDYAAAPNNALFDNTGIAHLDVPWPASVFPVPAPEGTAYNDPPIWHYRDGRAAIGLGPLAKTVTLTDRVRHALDVAVNLRILGDYIGPPVYAERYHVNVRLWHDGRSLMPTDRLAQTFPLADLLSGLQAEVPWARVDGSLRIYVAPRDDPGMAAALDRAKAEGGGTYVPTPAITDHIDAHRDAYVDPDPGALQILAGLFLFEGHYALVLPVIVGGVSIESADGQGWGTLSSANDYVWLRNGQDMGKVARELARINAHEIGHYFGLYHAHDGSRHTPQGYEPYTDHTWSSTNTVMSYRFLPPTTDTFHREHLARAHALDNLERTVRNARDAYRALDAAGAEAVPAGVAGTLASAGEAHNAAARAYREGRFIDAVHAAIDGRRASDAALAAANVRQESATPLTWSSSGVFSAGAKASALVLRAGVAPGGVRFDLKRLPIGSDVDAVTVRVNWTNTPASWGDFFAAWRLEGSTDPLGFGATPLASVVDLGGGVHDSRDEGPTDGPCTESFTLDLDAFPAFRDGATLLVGAGTRGDAVNGAYAVEVQTLSRTLGVASGASA